jgi:hypothetical protein
MRILAALVALAATHVHVISGDTSIGGVHLARTNASGAAALFGAPAASRMSGQECVQRWPKLGLTLELGNAGLSPRPPCATGVALRMTITSRSAWRTSTGVRVGDTVARLRARYPHATHHAVRDGRRLPVRLTPRDRGGREGREPRRDHQRLRLSRLLLP